jgi:GTP-binding protein YchF
MGFSLGIVGLPNVGKSTIFNALSKAGAEVSNYPFCTKDKNAGVVEVPDPRVAKVAELMKSPKAIPTIIEFVDIAGLVKGASKGEGLGNQFLSYVREVDAIAHVVRCFEDPNIAHVDGSVDPKRDIETIHTELALADLATVGKKLRSVKNQTKTGDKKALKEVAILEKIEAHLNSGKPVRTAKLPEEERIAIKDLHLLTEKPVLYVINIGEAQIGAAADSQSKTVADMAKAEGAGVVAISGKLESELGELSQGEAEAYEKEVGLTELGLPKLIRAGYELLNLITFFTSNEKETRAWTVQKGTKAPRAAGKVHTDMERGFISAEIIHYDDLIKAGSHAKAKELGIARTEGKGYAIKDGDIAYFRFNV